MWWDTIRSVEDLYLLMEFEKLIHPESDCLTLSEYISWLKMGLDVTILKETSKKWKGSYQTLESDDGDIIFVGFGRHPDYKGKGIGQILINRLIAHNKNKSLICETRQNNKNMIQLLKYNNFYNFKHEFKNNEDWLWWKYVN